MELQNRIEINIGFYSALILTIITILTFAASMFAIPPAGPYCPNNCMEYPYENILSYFPRDYIWMYLASFQVITLMIFFISTYSVIPDARKIIGIISIVFGILSSSVLLINYYVQYAVVPISVLKNEREGISLLTQYNGHGIFIALEELGFILMSIAYAFLSLAFSKASKLHKSIKLLMLLPIIVIFISFIGYSLIYGLDRDYRFEVVAITINWITTIIIGILMCIKYHRMKI